MIAGAFALAAYSWTVCVLLKNLVMASLAATMLSLVVWFIVAFGIASILFGIR
jgi:hypothetical protein